MRIHHGEDQYHGVESRRVEKDFNRVESYVRTTENLRGKGWDISEKQEKTFPASWYQIFLNENQVFGVDESVFEVILLHDFDRSISELEPSGWKKIGLDTHGLHVYMRPRLSSLDFKRLDNVKINEEKDVFLIQVGTLIASLWPVLKSDLGSAGFNVDDQEKWCEISIERAGLFQQKPVDDQKDQVNANQKRNPSVASSSIYSDVKTLFMQLNEMGYKYIVALPSDARRARVYQRIGMKPFVNDMLFVKIDELLK